MSSFCWNNRIRFLLPWRNQRMVLITDGISEYGTHVWSDFLVFWTVKSSCLHRQQLQSWKYFHKKAWIPCAPCLSYHINISTAKIQLTIELYLSLLYSFPVSERYLVPRYLRNRCARVDWSRLSDLMNALFREHSNICFFFL